MVDILNKQSIAPNIKKINHIYELNDDVYFSCDFGIVKYNLDRLEFVDTYLIGNTGGVISVKQTTIKKYSVLQLCKHLERYQLENDIFLYRFDLNYKAIYSIKKVRQPLGYRWNDFLFYCAISDLNKSDIIQILNDIYTEYKNKNTINTLPNLIYLLIVLQYYVQNFQAKLVLVVANVFWVQNRNS